MLCWSEHWSKLKSSRSRLWPCCLCSKAIIWFPQLHWFWNLTHLLSYLEPKRQQQKMLQPYAQSRILCQDSNPIFISSPTPTNIKKDFTSFPQNRGKRWPRNLPFLLSLSSHPAQFYPLDLKVNSWARGNLSLTKKKREIAYSSKVPSSSPWQMGSRISFSSGLGGSFLYHLHQNQQASH